MAGEKKNSKVYIMLYWKLIQSYLGQILYYWGLIHSYPGQIQSWLRVNLGVPDHPKVSPEAIFCHLNHYCVVFKSARQLWKKLQKDTINTLRIIYLKPLQQINFNIYNFIYINKLAKIPGIGESFKMFPTKNKNVWYFL